MFAPKLARTGTPSIGKESAAAGSKHAKRRSGKDAVSETDRPRKLAETHGLQRKLQIGKSNDPLEQEADRVANQVMRMPSPALSPLAAPEQVSRMCAACENEEPLGEKLQTKLAGTAGVVGEVPPAVYQLLRSPGAQLDAGTRADFEPRFGYDFGNVRVHDDQQAAESAHAINALAYTAGHHIVFAAGAHGRSAWQRKLLAHELTHVIQQSRSRTPLSSAGSIVQRQSSGEKEPKSPAKGFEGTVPLILRVESDAVVVVNALARPETVSMRTFASSAWEPGNPANPAVARANEAYRKVRVAILTGAGRRPLATFEGWRCDDAQKRLLRSDLSLALSYVNRALDKLPLAEGRARLKVMQAQDPGKGKPKLSQDRAELELKQVAFHFKTESPEDLRRIISNFGSVKEELGNVTDFSCGGALCRIGHNLAWTTKSSGAAAQINICATYWDLNTYERALTIVHEATHKAFGTGDPGYYREALKLPREKALNNAESYGNYALGKYNDEIK